MAVYKDKNGTWYFSAKYTNWKGEADRKVKRGFLCLTHTDKDHIHISVLLNFII